MKVTSQIRSPACVTPDVLPGEDVTEIDLPAVETDPAALGRGDGLVVKRVGQILESAIHTSRPPVEIRGHFHV
jgi:hypothetical protein